MLDKLDSSVQAHGGVFGQGDAAAALQGNVPAGQAACSEVLASAYAVAQALTEALEASEAPMACASGLAAAGGRGAPAAAGACAAQLEA